MLNALRAGKLAVNVKSRPGGTPLLKNGENLGRVTVPKAYIRTFNRDAVRQFSPVHKSDDKFGIIVPTPADEVFDRRNSELSPKTRQKDLEMINEIFEECEKLKVGDGPTELAGNEFEGRLYKSVTDILWANILGNMPRTDKSDPGHRYICGKTIYRDASVVEAFIDDPIAGLYILGAFPAGTQFIPSTLMEKWIESYKDNKMTWPDIRNELLEDKVRKQVDNYASEVLKSRILPSQETRSYLCFGGSDFVEYKGYVVTRSGGKTTIEILAMTIDGLHNLSGVVRWITLYNKDVPGRVRFFWYGVGDANDPRPDGANSLISRLIFLQIPDRVLDGYKEYVQGSTAEQDTRQIVFDLSYKDDLVRLMIRQLMSFGAYYHSRWKDPWKKHDPKRDDKKTPRRGDVEAMFIAGSSPTETVCYQITDTDLAMALERPADFIKKLEVGSFRPWKADPQTRPGLYLDNVPVVSELNLFPLANPAKVWKSSEVDAVAKAISQAISNALTADVMKQYQLEVHQESQALYQNATNKREEMSPITGERTDVQALPPNLYDPEIICTGLIDHGVLDVVREKLTKLETDVMTKVLADTSLSNVAKASTNEDKINSLSTVVQAAITSSALTGDNAWLLAAAATSATQILMDMVSPQGPLIPSQDMDTSEMQVKDLERRLKSARIDENVMMVDYRRKRWQQRLDSATTMNDLSKSSQQVREQKKRDVKTQLAELESEMVDLFQANLSSIISNECLNGVAIDPPAEPQGEGDSINTFSSNRLVPQSAPAHSGDVSQPDSKTGMVTGIEAQPIAQPVAQPEKDAVSSAGQIRPSPVAQPSTTDASPGVEGQPVKNTSPSANVAPPAQGGQPLSVNTLPVTGVPLEPATTTSPAVGSTSTATPQVAPASPTKPKWR